MSDLFTAHSVMFAPMAGVSDVVYRGICSEFGADVTFTEMVSALGIRYNPDRAAELRMRSPKENIVGLQLFGDDPHVMSQIARDYSHDFDFVDINMGCPAPKIVRNNQGSALMRDPQKAADIVKAMVDTIDLPVTVKIRTGWDASHINAVEFAMMIESAGASALTIHGRHRHQFYQGRADLSIIADVVDALSIPVVGNGDIYTPADAVNMIQQTKCHSVMIARGAQGNPFLFAQVRATLSGEPPPSFGADELVRVILTHAQGLMQIYDERPMSLIMRKQLCWYVKGLHEASHLKHLAIEVSSYQDIVDFSHALLDLDISK